MTVNDLEAALVALCRGWMAEAGLSTAPSTTSAPNAATLVAISWGMERLQAPPLVFARPTDAEVGAVHSPYLLLDLAEYRLLQAIVQNRAGVTTSETVQSRSVTRTDSSAAMGARIAFLQKALARFLLGPVVGSTIDIRSSAGGRPAAEF